MYGAWVLFRILTNVWAQWNFECLNVNKRRLKTCLTCFGALNEVFVCLNNFLIWMLWTCFLALNEVFVCLVNHITFLDIVNLFWSLEWSICLFGILVCLFGFCKGQVELYLLQCLSVSWDFNNCLSLVNLRMFMCEWGAGWDFSNLFWNLNISFCKFDLSICLFGCCERCMGWTLCVWVIQLSWTVQYISVSWDFNNCWA